MIQFNFDLVKIALLFFGVVIFLLMFLWAFSSLIRDIKRKKLEFIADLFAVAVFVVLIVIALQALLPLLGF